MKNKAVQGDGNVTRLNQLSDDNWKDLKEIVVFGFGRQGKKMYTTLSRDFSIKAIVDNSPDKQGMRVGDLTVLAFEEAQSLMAKYRVIVTTSQYYYQDIRRQLSMAGLEENRDFVMYQQFVTEWYYKYRNRVNVLKTDISLTTICNLRCENCMQFLPYWKSGRRGEHSFSEIKTDVDTYFQCIDYLLDLDVVGGEPFLYSELKTFIRYIGENYRDRIGYIGFITNGTVVPDDETFELIRKYKMDISISDYSEDISYNHRLEELCGKITEYGISYMRNRNIDWFDFGFPRELYHYEGEEAVKHMQCCNSIEHILDDGKLFYCGLEWSAQKGGLYPVEEKAYVDLDRIARGEAERKSILEMILANIPGGCLEFCKVCGGFGIDNNNRVETAKQLER